MAKAYSASICILYVQSLKKKGINKQYQILMKIKHLYFHFFYDMF